MTIKTERDKRAGVLSGACLSAEAWLTLVACWIDFRLFGYRRTCEHLTRLRRLAGLRSWPGDCCAIQTAVFKASRWLPGGSNCLLRAVAIWNMSAWRGKPALIRFGVRHTGDGLSMHAWVEWPLRSRCGAGQDAESYRPLLPAPAHRIQHRLPDSGELIEATRE